ncbi:isochorismatase family protein [Sphingobium sp.]|uniref:cysteine hydrolase family protein n=1 Tax=Sphingobium sp. TaxID=1912891 RepID=UPI0028BF45E5|nr:isochorismatase family protein [Sphingobium sp.]
MTGFVIVVDMQRDFVMPTGALPVPDAAALVVPMERWLAALDPREVTGVLMTFDTHVPDVYAGSPEAKQFPVHCVRGTPGWEGVLRFEAPVPVYTLEKGVFDMWAEPGLMVHGADGQSFDRDAFFEGLAKSAVDRVTVAGVATDYCVRWAIEGLLARGFRVELPASLTRGIAKAAEEVAAEIGGDLLLLN